MTLHRQFSFEIGENTEVVVPPGQLAFAPFEVKEDDFSLFSLIHTEINSQDSTLLAWFSEEVGGPPMEKNEPQKWNLKRMLIRNYGLMDENATYPDDSKIPCSMSFVKPGSFWLNVLNLSNNNNKFNLSVMDSSSFVDDDDGESHNCDC